jgi:hypothetical protein
MTLATKRIGLLAVLLALWAGQASAAPPQLVDPAPGARLKWLLKPDILEISRILGHYNPAEGAFAAVECTIARNGRPKECIVIEESPTGGGMARSTIEVVALYKAASKDSLGRPAAGQKVSFALRLGSWGE